MPSTWPLKLLVWPTVQKVDILPLKWHETKLKLMVSNISEAGVNEGLACLLYKWLKSTLNIFFGHLGQCHKLHIQHWHMTNLLANISIHFESYLSPSNTFKFSTHSRLSFDFGLLHLNVHKLAVLACAMLWSWGWMEIDSLLEPASSGHSTNCSFWHFCVGFI